MTTGEVNEGDTIVAQVDEVRATTGHEMKTVTADAGYAYGKVYGGLERRGIDPLIPAKREPIRSRMPKCRFRYDAKNDIVKCPRGKVLRPGKPLKDGRFFYSRVKDCARCPLRGDCISKARSVRTVLTADEHPAILRARRRKLRKDEEDRRPCKRHRWRSEGFHGEVKNWHGLRRVVLRPRKHEDPVLPDGRRDQPEAARDRFPSVISCLPHDSDARNACFSGPGAMGGPESPHARRICLTPPGEDPPGPHRAAQLGSRHGPGYSTAPYSFAALVTNRRDRSRPRPSRTSDRIHVFS